MVHMGRKLALHITLQSVKSVEKIQAYFFQDYPDSRKKNRNGALKAMQMPPLGGKGMLRAKQTFTSKASSLLMVPANTPALCFFK